MKSLFKKVLYAILIGIGLSTIGVLFSKTQSIVTPFVDLCSWFTTYYIIRGICSLAVKMEDNEMKLLAEKACKIVCITLAASNLMELFEGYTTVFAAISIIGAILEIAGYCYFLKVLSRSKTMLARSFSTQNNMEPV